MLSIDSIELDYQSLAMRLLNILNFNVRLIPRNKLTFNMLSLLELCHMNAFFSKIHFLLC